MRTRTLAATLLALAGILLFHDADDCRRRPPRPDKSWAS
jgi:hypothetical protein